MDEPFFSEVFIGFTTEDLVVQDDNIISKVDSLYRKIMFSQINIRI